jgi:hypothetical protein
MKSYVKQVDVLQALIDKAKADDIMAIEPDSTWESGYWFDKIVLLKTRITVYYTEYNGTPLSGGVQKDVTMLSQEEDVKYVLSWVKRAIKKGYKEDAKRIAQEEKEERDNDLDPAGGHGLYSHI